MKVGHILKEELKDISGLKLPYKILINENFRYSENKKIENSLFLKYSNAFMYDMQSSYNKKPIQKSKSLSKTFYRLKSLKNTISSKDFSTIKSSDKNLEKIFIYDNLPQINDLTPEKNKKIISHSTKKLIPHYIFAQKSIFDKKNRKNIKDVIENNKNSTDKIIHINYKNGINSNLRNKINTKSNIQDPFMANLQVNNNMKTIFQLRYKRKFKIVNKIIDKLNKPLFINNNLDYMNRNKRSNCFPF